MPIRSKVAAVALFAFLVAGCAVTPSTAPATLAPPTQPPPTPAVSPSVAPSSSPSVAPSASTEVTPNPTGFAFASDAVLAYYAGVGYACSDATPSTEATGYTVRSCELIDPAGRTLTVGLVTDAGGDLGDAWASVRATADEDVLDPVDALDPLSGFLGAMLGSDRGGALVTWLAGHLGDAYAETSDGGLRIATYTPSPDDHSEIYLELANQAYLAAPRPSAG